MVILAWLVVWQLVAWAVRSEVLLASPWNSLIALIRLAPTAGFWLAILASTWRILAGFLLGMILGSVLALAGARWPWIDAVCSPFIRVLRAVPVVSFVLLVLVWGDGRSLSIIIAVIMVTPVAYANVLAAMTSRDQKLIEMAAVFHLTWTRRWWAITVPALMPHLTSATRIGVGLAWKAGISAEVIGATSGSIGERLQQAKLFLATGDLFAWTVVIVVLAFVSERILLAGLAATESRLEVIYG
jgi:NitT/TauT family transport system permease protein